MLQQNKYDLLSSIVDDLNPNKFIIYMCMEVTVKYIAVECKYVQINQSLDHPVGCVSARLIMLLNYENTPMQFLEIFESYILDSLTS